MIEQLRQLANSKPNLVFDFDKTIAQMEIDWTDWHDGVSKIYDQFDPNHGYVAGKDPHKYYNALARKHGYKLIKEVQNFVSQYEEEYTSGFTPYADLVTFIQTNSKNDLFIYSSNARKTVVKGLEELGLLEKFDQVITRDDVDLIKPEPEGFYLIDGFNGNEDDFLMTGDSAGDETAAKAVGVDFLKCEFFGTYQFSDE